MDLRQTIFDLPLQSVITRDNVEITVHPMMVIQITDPIRVCYEVKVEFGGIICLDFRPDRGCGAFGADFPSFCDR